MEFQWAQRLRTLFFSLTKNMHGESMVVYSFWPNWPKLFCSISRMKLFGSVGISNQTNLSTSPSPKNIFSDIWACQNVYFNFKFIDPNAVQMPFFFIMVNIFIQMNSNIIQLSNINIEKTTMNAGNNLKTKLKIYFKIPSLARLSARTFAFRNTWWNVENYKRCGYCEWLPFVCVLWGNN